MPGGGPAALPTPIGTAAPPTPTAAGSASPPAGAPPTAPDATATPAPTPTGPGPLTPPTTTPTPTPTPTSTPTTAPTVIGQFDPALAPEVSGVVASRRDPDLLWLLDDGPGTTSVVAVRSDGQLVTRVTMDGVEGRDTEDIAAGPCAADDPTPCLYVGDIGDNIAGRDAVQVHRFPEPAVDATSTPVTTATYTHPRGPVDAEALLVGSDGLPVILTKEADMASVMVATAFADGPLAEVGPLPIPTPDRPLLTRFTGLTITGADLSPDGQRVLLRTYDHVIELTAPGPGSPLQELGRWTAVELPVAREPQGEAITYLADGWGYVTASEGSGALSAVMR